MNRLILVVSLGDEQIKADRWLRDAEGLCTCGRKLTRLSPKFIFCSAVTENPLDKNKKNTLIMGAYCYGCFMEVQGVLKRLRSSVKQIGAAK